MNLYTPAATEAAILLDERYCDWDNEGWLKIHRALNALEVIAESSGKPITREALLRTMPEYARAYLANPRPINGA